MAAVTQTVTTTPKITSFAGIPFGPNNIYPRARIIFAEPSVAITAKGAGDTKRILIEYDLPPNFAYSFDESFITLTDTTAAP